MSIRTHLPPDQASDRLHELIRPESFTGGLLPDFRDARPFVGRSKGSAFTFWRRRTFWHNSFTPIVSGTITYDARGTVFDARVRLAYPVMAMIPLLLITIGGVAGPELVRYVKTAGAEGSLGMVMFLALFGAAGTVNFQVDRRGIDRILQAALTGQSWS